MNLNKLDSIIKNIQLTRVKHRVKYANLSWIFNIFSAFSVKNKLCGWTRKVDTMAPSKPVISEIFVIILKWLFLKIIDNI